MSDDAILKILDEAIINGQDPENHAFAVEEAAQQLRQYIETEVIGEDNPHTPNAMAHFDTKNYVYRCCERVQAQNRLRTEQRKKLREPME